MLVQVPAFRVDRPDLDLKDDSGEGSPMQANSKRRAEKRKRQSAASDSSGDERRKWRKGDGRRNSSLPLPQDEDEDDSLTEDGQVSRQTRFGERSRDPKHERNKHKGKARRRSLSPTGSSDNGTSSDANMPLNSGSRPASDSPVMANDHLACRTVYRAIYEERIHNIGLDQAPCTRCPTFDFCQSGGPIEPQSCVYYESWLDRDETQAMSS